MRDASEILLKNEQCRGNNQHRRNFMPLASSQPPSSSTLGENIVVGIEDTTTRILDRLTSYHNSSRQIISISGMGGIGKTTLARKVYDHPCVTNYFHICAWATVSKDYNTHESLVQLLNCLNGTSREGQSEKSEHELGDTLHKSLFGRRYLVILDDVWDVEALKKLKFFFPDCRGSRIVITNRDSTFASISSHSFEMEFLDEHRSWDLFCKKVFGNDSCPRELENLGKNIANNCRGLPLSIVVIAGHLAKSPRTQEYWKYIAKNLSSIVNSENNDQCLKILSLSYTHLPVHLKPCFLHMGSFLEDADISVSKLARLWTIEGFLKPIHGKSPEDFAQECLNDLAARNLIFASSLSMKGKIRCYKMNDLLRDLCLKKGKESNFFFIVHKQMLHLIPRLESRQPISFSTFCEPTRIHKLDDISEDYNLFRRLPLSGGYLTTAARENHVDFLDVALWQCLMVTLSNSCEVHYVVPPFFFSWNLHSLTIQVWEEIKAPPEIWEMPLLRRIKIKYLVLPDPPRKSHDILKNVRSLKTILNFNLSEDVLKRVPNIKRLEVEYHDKVEGFNKGAYSLANIARLEKLESLRCIRFPVDFLRRNDIMSGLTFPHSLKKLDFARIHWDDVTTKISSLPSLEVLILRFCRGREWEHNEGRFVRLKYLVLKFCDDLERLTANKFHFPCLKELLLFNMKGLNEISPEIGDIPTLRSIKTAYCPDSAVASAKEIAEMQCEAGNEELQVDVLLDKESNISLSPEKLSATNFYVRVHSFSKF